MLPFRYTVLAILKYTTIGFSIVIMVGISAHLFAGVIGINMGANAINSLNLLRGKTWLYLAFSAIAEELTFRAFLSTSKLGVTLSITGLLYAAMSHLINNYKEMLLVQNSADRILLSGGAVLLLLMITYLSVNKVHEKIKQFIVKHYAIFFWASCTAFASAHILNYDNHHFLLDYIILVFPQFTLGALLAYVRIRFGIIHSIAAHFLIDALLFMLMLIKLIHFQPAVFGIASVVVAVWSVGVVFTAIEAKTIIVGMVKPQTLLRKNFPIRPDPQVSVA